jgi:ABC-2 type transport system ATP-binding protein
MIQVNNLSKEFKVHKKEEGLKASIKSLFKREYIIKEAIKNINLTINDGEIIGLIGANGAGKTTLTKILSGIIPATKGDVSVLGFDPWKRDNQYRSQMSLIMGQKAQLWWDLPAMDGYLLLKEIYQIPENEFRERIGFLSESLRISKELNVQVRKLSLGERMKVELIAALLHNPKVVFLDEPTIGLDLTAQKAVRKFIKEYRQKFQPIMILTSHYMDDIEDLCKRVAIMREGQIIFDGDISEIQNNYAQNKTIKVFSSIQIDPNEFPQELGTLKTISDSEFLVISPKNQVMKAANFLLSHYDILDLTIQEEEIADLIEKIMSEQNV